MAEPIDTAGVYQLNERTSRPTSNRLTGGVDALWRWLTDYRLLLAVVGVTFLFLLVAFLLPQMPDSLRDDPGESTRWLVTTSARYGPFGDLLGQFGFFNVLQSPLLKLALTAIALLLMIHLAELIGVAWQLRALSGAVSQPGGVVGEPLPLPRGRQIFRLRAGVAMTIGGAEPKGNETASGLAIDALIDAIAAQMVASLGAVARHTADVAPSPTQVAILDDSAPVIETRLLAVRSLTAAYLRPLLMFGLLLALAAAWLLINFGWSLTVPTLVPGKTERFTAQNVELRYDVMANGTAGESGVAPVLTIMVGDEEAQVNVSDAARSSVNGVDVKAYSTVPGLLVRTVSGQPQLSLPGQSTPASAIGLIFPSVGSEEVVLLENQSAGLRIVRIGDQSPDMGQDSPIDGPTDGLNDDEMFMVEIYSGTTAAPDQRIYVKERISKTVEFRQGQVVELLPVDGVGAQLRRTPGAWLVWPALASFLVGVYGFWKKPAFALAQISPWADETAVVVAQSDLRSELDEIELDLILSQTDVELHDAGKHDVGKNDAGEKSEAI